VITFERNKIGDAIYQDSEGCARGGGSGTARTPIDDDQRPDAGTRMLLEAESRTAYPLKTLTALRRARRTEGKIERHRQAKLIAEDVPGSACGHRRPMQR
jgi:hypothetical protein